MFMDIVFVLLAVLLVWATGTALHMGLFKSARPEIGLAKKTLTGFVSYGVSVLFWYAAYGIHYLDW